MHVLLVNAFLGSGILLSCKTGKTFLEHVDFEGVEGRDQNVNPHVELEAVHEQRVRHVLRNDVPRFALHLLPTANDFDASTAGSRVWFHDVHVLVVLLLSVQNEFAVVVGEQIGFGAEIELREKHAKSAKVFPH